MKNFLVLLFFMLSFSASAEACIPGPLTKADIAEIKENAYFIGQVKLLSYKKTKDLYLKATYEVITPYKTSKNFDSKVIKVKRESMSSCDRSFGEVGQIYEEIFYDAGPEKKDSDQKDLWSIFSSRNSDINILWKSQIFSDIELWENLKKDVKYSPEILSLKSKCEEKGGVWETASDNDFHRQVSCRYKTAD